MLINTNSRRSVGKLTYIVCASAFAVWSFAPKLSCAEMKPDVDSMHSTAIRVGMSAAFSGPAKALGLGMRDGIASYFDHINSSGGIDGRRLHLVTRNDEYEPSKTAPNMRALAKEGVFAVIGNVGTPTAAVAVPIANELKLPMFGAFTGAGLLRKTPPDRYVWNYRASYAEETSEMVRGLIDVIGLKPEQVGFFTQNDAYGDAGWNGGVAAIKRKGFAEAERLPHGRYPRNTIHVEGGLSVLLDPRHDIRAVIMVGAYRPCARFIQLARKHGFNPLFINVSFVGSEALKKELGSDGEGVIVTQVVPDPEGELPAAREFQALVPRARRNFVSFEGFLAAKAFVQGIRTACELPGFADRQFDCETFVDAMESGHPIDVGIGRMHALSKDEHQFSHQVWPTIIRDNRFVALKSWQDAIDVTQSSSRAGKESEVVQ